MNTDTIQIQGLQPGYRPGETITGTVSWSGAQAPGKIEVRLFWVTSGPMPRQVGLVGKRVLAAPKPTDASRFEFVLPEGPWSFQGMLVRLSWAVEAVMLPSRQHAQTKFALGPEGRAVVAPELEQGRGL